MHKANILLQKYQFPSNDFYTRASMPGTRLVTIKTIISRDQLDKCFFCIKCDTDNDTNDEVNR